MGSMDEDILAAGALAETKFDLIQGAVVIDRQGVGFWGGRGVQHLFLAPGRCFDLTCGVGGADRLYLCGSSADHRVEMDADVLILCNESQGSQIKLHASRGPRELVFDDGSVTLGVLWSNVRQVSALLCVVGESSACELATVASHVKAAPRIAVGALPDGALLQVEGLAGIETVYGGKPGASVHFDGRLAEHAARLAGKTLAVSRRSSGLLETAYIAGSARLVFADGGVQSDALGQAVKYNDPWPVPEGEVIPVLPRITAVALDVDSAKVDWTDDWLDAMPSGLFGGCRPGQVFEASVSLQEPVTVDGAPRLRLCVGGRHRVAQFSGGSGSDTLRFVYTITEDDIANASGSETRGLTLTGPGNLDVDVGPFIVSGASIRAVNTLPPLASGDVAMPVETNTGESEWHVLHKAGEPGRGVPMTLFDEISLYEDGYFALSHGSVIRGRPDFELDLLLDINLVDLELAAEKIDNGLRKLENAFAEQTH